MKTPIEILDEMIDELNPEWFIPSNTDLIVTSYLREAKERIQKETWWISVEDRLPKTPDEDWLVVVRNKNKEDWWIFLFDVWNFTSDWVWAKWNTWERVTHWMPLPLPPNE